ncbi:hypothetical protein B0H13DRAFT_2353077 [Mycena leptocephala]|nr:hypothetical protein B0H13DRAFT_2353077 [Mycena leptocephala]
MSVASLDVTADEGQDPRDEISVADESAGSPFRDTQEDDRRLLSLCQQLHDARVCPPTPELTAHAGSDQLSRSPSPLAQYEHPPIVGSRAPTPTYQPDTPPPLFLPCSDDETDNEAPLSRNAADAPPAHPRPRPPSPPRKRRRVHKSTNNEKILAHVKRFVDLEAQETDVEEEDDETDADMVGFIDDDPVDDEPVHHPEDVHRERWRRVPESHRRRREQREIEAHELEKRPSATKTWRVKPVCLIQSSKAKDRSPQPSRDSHIPATVPSTDSRSPLEAISNQLTPEERVPALSFPSFQSPVGRWARVIAGTQLYKNDIVFVMDDSEYLAIPRVPYAKVLDTTLPLILNYSIQLDFRLCTPATNSSSATCSGCGAKNDDFKVGLNTGRGSHRTPRSRMPSRVTVSARCSRKAVIALSRHPLHRSMLRAARRGSCGRRPGEHTGRTGFIVVLAEMKQKDAQTKRDRLVRVAAVLERYNGTDAISKKSLESKENPCFAVAIQCLRLHILSTPRPLSIDDRVAVVAGAARGSSGRVESIGDDGVVTISVSGSEPCQVEMRHLRRDFRVCDVVEIIRGPKQGTAGFVVEVHTGGFVVFYPCTIPRMFNAMSDGYSFNREAIQPHTIYEDPTHLEQSTPFAVANSNLKFIPIDAQGFVAQPPAEFYASPTMQTAAQNRALYDELHTKWELDRMHTSKWFEGMFIQVGGKHPRKGIFGVVKGFRLHALPSQRKMRGQLPDITLRIQQDASLAEFDAKLNQLWDRYTNLPLQQALYFRKLGPINLWKKAEPVAEPVSWPKVCVVPEPAPTKFGFASFIGETNGGWLLQPEFVNKRIDVKVVDVKACLNTHLRKINTKTFAAEGKVGYLSPFPVPVNETKLNRDNLEVRLEPMSHPTMIPPGAIRPHRRTVPDPTTGLDQCISAAVGPVIIIGPDVYGSRQRVGQYAETIPASIQHGSLVVEVRFPLESGGRPPNGTYHLECLCRSRNVTLDAWNIPATDFDAPFDPVWAQEGWTKSAKTKSAKTTKGK